MNNDKEGDISIPFGAQQINWDEVGELLGKKIYEEMRKSGQDSGGGTVEDIAQLTFEKFLDSEDHLGWDPRKVREGLTVQEGLAYFLLGVAKNTTRDAKKYVTRRRHLPFHFDGTGERRGDEDELLPFPVKAQTSYIHSPESDLMYCQLRDYLVSLVPGDPVAIEMIKRAAETTGRGKGDQELAELVLGSKEETKQIVNARKRIKRAAAKDEGYLQWTKKRMTPAVYNRTTSPTL